MSHRTLRFAIGASLLVGTPGCDDGPIVNPVFDTGPPDAGVDASSDAGAPEDVGPPIINPGPEDAGPEDAGPDDAGFDASTDDAGTDDAGFDAGPGDA